MSLRMLRCLLILLLLSSTTSLDQSTTSPFSTLKVQDEMKVSRTLPTPKTITPETVRDTEVKARETRGGEKEADELSMGVWLTLGFIELAWSVIFGV